MIAGVPGTSPTLAEATVFDPASVSFTLLGAGFSLGLILATGAALAIGFALAFGLLGSVGTFRHFTFFSARQ
jgi:hypothetical protein